VPFHDPIPTKVCLGRGELERIIVGKCLGRFGKTRAPVLRNVGFFAIAVMSIALVFFLLQVVE
jgi:hypothetical protein